MTQAASNAPYTEVSINEIYHRNLEASEPTSFVFSCVDNVPGTSKC